MSKFTALYVRRCRAVRPVDRRNRHSFQRSSGLGLLSRTCVSRLPSNRRRDRDPARQERFLAVTPSNLRLLPRVDRMLAVGSNPGRHFNHEITHVLLPCRFALHPGPQLMAQKYIYQAFPLHNQRGGSNRAWYRLHSAYTDGWSL